MRKLFDFFSRKKRLEKEYEKLMKKSFEYSRIDRKTSDIYFQKAQDILKQIEEI